MIPILYPVNLLAPPAVVTTTGAAAAGYPTRRLYDRDVGVRWRDGGTGTRDVLIDQGATGTQPVDTLIISAAHNLAGITATLDSGPTSGALTTRATFTVGSGLHRQTIPARYDRWWRLRFAGTTVAPEAAEIVLSLAVPFPSSPVLRGQDVGQLANVVDLESYGGFEWGLARGPIRWTAMYPLIALDQSSRDALVGAYVTLDGGAKHCYLTDGDGVTRWVTWSNRQLRFASPLQNTFDVLLSFREVLGAA